jgi:hypothetical protein
LCNGPAKKCICIHCQTVIAEYPHLLVITYATALLAKNANFATGVATVDDEHQLGYQLVSQVRRRRK